MTKVTRMRRLFFKGNLVTRTRFVNELDISLKNIWFTLEADDGEVIYSNMYRIEGSKAKEVFAYLVHRHGSSCTTKELFTVIFEDEPYDKKLQNLLQTYIFAMMKSLKAVGAEKAVVRSYNALAVNVDVLDCDYYRFQELDAGAVNAYETEYMSQYYWADFLYNGY